jgi:hypothetical protein
VAGETNVGGILGFLRLDADQFHREIERAIAETEILDGKNVDVKVKTDSLDKMPRSARGAATALDGVTSSARRLEDATGRVNVATLKLSELEDSGKAKASQIVSARQALARARRDEQDAIFATYNGNLNLAKAEDKAAAAGDRVTKSNERVSKSGRDGQRSMGALATAVIALGPALVPVAAGAVGLAAAFGGLGAAGVLAIVGINDEMKKGSALGLTYQSTLDDAKTSVMGLAKVAASNVLGPLQAAVKDLQDKTPRLTGIIGEFSTMAGKTAGVLTSGLLSAFIALEPLMRDAGTYILNLSQRFASAMSGPGIVSFGDYVRSVFPQVMAAVESIVTAAGHLVAAFAPLGMGTLTLIGNLANLISLFPVDTLATVATVAGDVFLGFKAWQGISGLVDGLGGALGRLGVSADVSATAMRGLQAAAGIIGVAIAALSFIVSANAEDQRKAEEATNRYADALRASNGVIDESVRKSTAKTLADQGVLDAARKLGIALPDVTDAALGNADAQARVNAVLDAQSSKLKVTTTGAKSGVQANTELGDAADKVTGAIHGENAALTAGIQKNKDIAAATATNKGATSDAAIAMGNLASTYGVSVPTMQAVIDAQKKSAEQAAIATAQMQYENNAAGLLKQSLDALSGKSLSAAQAQNAFDSSLANMTTRVDKAGKKVTVTSSALNDMSSASVALRGQLLGQVTAAEQTAEAYGQMKGSSEAGRKKLLELRDQIIKNAVAHGVDKKAVESYIDQVLKVPKSVPPTKFDVQKAAAEQKVREFVGVINGVPTWRTVTLNVVSNVNAAVANVRSALSSIGAAAVATKKATGGQIEGRANGGPVPGFAGGTLVGPGTGTSDSIMAMVAQTGKLLRVSAGEFVSTDASRRRNRAALEAGNRGATLQVAGAGPSLVGVVITGTLNSPWGPVQVEGQIEEALRREALEVGIGGR